MNTSRDSFKYSVMLDSQNQKQEIVNQIIKPENPLERQIIKDAAWLEGAFWGEPRRGHPEGKVIYHIQEVLSNVDRLSCSKKIRAQLRLITLIHDTFKHKEEQVRPRKDWSKHHAIYAWKFAHQYISDKAVLDVIELHDEAYYAWGMSYYHHNQKGSQKRLKAVQKRMKQHMQLYYLFFKCDTKTGDKTQKPLDWFEQSVSNITLVNL
ncbi:MAG: hypothetical protein MK212_02545 [Saprospiraceae bacterium]|nr:hypothetical protein [Saprospiraceae bacterium]